MAFKQADVGPLYDIGLATRDGSTLNCLDENGATRTLSQVAYMFSAQAGVQQTESTDLIRKQQLTQLSSSNVIDREFTLFPQAQQGAWTSGELQRFWTDPAGYYTGRGLIFPSTATSVTRPYVNTPGITGATAWPGVVAGGYYAASPATVGYAIAYTDAGGARIAFQPNTGAAVVSPALTGAAQDAVMANGEIFFTQAGQANLYTGSGNAMVINTFVAGGYTPIGVGNTLLTSAIIGNKIYLAAYSTINNAITIYDATNAAVSATFTLPANLTPTAMTFFGSQLYYVVTDHFNNTILAFDITSLTTTTVTSLPGYSYVKIGAAAGTIFVTAVSPVTPGVDLFLLVGSSLQFIASLPAVISGTSTLSYVQPSSSSNIVSFGPYAVVAVFCGATPGTVLIAYDVQRGALFTIDQLATGSIITGNGLAVTSGMTAGSPQGVGTAWSLVVQPTSSSSTPVYLAAIGVRLASGATLQYSGRVISSVIDFTSASVKLYRQIVITHNPIPTGGSVYLASWLDQDVTTLSATPQFSVTNSTVSSTVTTLVMNTIGKKLVYLDDYIGSTTANAPFPISIAIQASTGWVWKIILALSNSARMNAQQPNSFCYAQQGFDARAAYNFARQLWRLRGGQCLATFPNGDQYNAVIESEDFPSPKPLAVTASGDRKTRYETNLALTIREDL